MSIDPNKSKPSLLDQASHFEGAFLAAKQDRGLSLGGNIRLPMEQVLSVRKTK
jgi:hypothetical protein